VTLTLEDLALTPKQHAELTLAEPRVVSAWLEAVSLKSGLKSPAGWFLAGVRSGDTPPGLDDARERHAVIRAETLIANIGANIVSESELLDELFTPPELTADVETLEHVELETRTSPGRELYGPALLAQLTFTRAHGRQEIPHSGGVLAKHDTPALRARMVARWAMHHLGTERITDGHAPQSEHSSQTSAALTAVSDHTSVVDADADIDW
jgi:hypothetical protein